MKACRQVGRVGKPNVREISLELAIQLLHLHFLEHEIMLVIVSDNFVRDIKS